MSKPLFTQKHYEFLETVLGQCGYDNHVTALADALQKDNSNFRREIFMRRILTKRMERQDATDEL